MTDSLRKIQLNVTGSLKLWLVLVILIIILGAGLGAWLGGDSQPQTQPPPVQISDAELAKQRQSIEQTLSEDATVEDESVEAQQHWTQYEQLIEEHYERFVENPEP